jgi:hypothetical protein
LYTEIKKASKGRNNWRRAAERKTPMSLKAQTICPAPGETARVAWADYPKGNVYLLMRDVLGSIYTDEDFADLFPKGFCQN